MTFAEPKCILENWRNSEFDVGGNDEKWRCWRIQPTYEPQNHFQHQRGQFKSPVIMTSYGGNCCVILVFMTFIKQ